MTIKIIVLSSGENILGKVSQAKDGFLVENPVMMLSDPNPANRGRLIFVPYLQFTTLDKCKFENKDIRHVLGDVRDEIVNGYNREFGSGLVVPENNGIVLS